MTRDLRWAIVRGGMVRPAALISTVVLLAACDAREPLAPGATTASRATSGGSGPGAPSSLTSIATLPSRIDLAWQDNSSDETGFEVQRSTAGAGGPFVRVGTTGANVKAYRDSGLTALTQYCYEVRALRTTGQKTTYSAFSNTACATTPAPPAAPSDLRTAASTGHRIDLAWSDNAANETGFDVERCQGVGCTAFAEVVLVSANLTTWSDGAVSPSTTYSYRVRARSGGNFSAYSNVATATTPATDHMYVTVTTTTSGVDLDADGYGATVWKSGVLLGGASVPDNGSVMIDLESNPLVVVSPGGELVVELDDLAANCVFNSPNPQIVEMVGPRIATFDITCSPTTQLALASSADGNAEIYLVSSNGSGKTRLTSDPASDVEPAWSPDGTAIAFSSDRDGNSEIYVMSADGSNPMRLTNATGDDRSPSWSPDGSRIAFTSDRDGNREIYVMNADGTNPVNLSNNAADDGDPAWSPDGSRIAFRSDRDGRPIIYVMSANGSGVTRLTWATDPEADSQPAWSPDGSRIAFAHWWCGEAGCKSDILTMNADGSGVGWLTVADPSYPGEVHSHPTWSPDGREVAFASNISGVDVIRADGTGGSSLGAGVINITEGFDPAWRRSLSSAPTMTRTLKAAFRSSARPAQRGRGTPLRGPPRR